MEEDAAILITNFKLFVAPFVSPGAFIILVGSFVTLISALSLVNTRFLEKLIRWQYEDRGYEIEISTFQVVIGKLGAFIGLIGGTISLILSFTSP